MSRSLLFVLVFLLVGTLAAAQSQSRENPNGKKLRIERITRSNPASGPNMYQSHCASCHGTDGKGSGPAAEFLRTAPPDLTYLARHNHGKYPANHVFYTLKFGTAAHSEDALNMPVWESLFNSVDPDRMRSDLRVYNLTTYVESLQQ